MKTHAATILTLTDNGGPMKGSTMVTTLERLGVLASYSRPRVSDDNPYSEALFRALKYCPEYPTKAFVDVADARRWVLRFVTWYNGTHLHSGVRFVTPNARHAGKDVVILAQRVKVYEAARAKNPARWTMSICNWTPVDEVYLNPDKPQSKLRNAHALKRVVKHVAKENTLTNRASRTVTSVKHMSTSKRATESPCVRIVAAPIG